MPRLFCQCKTEYTLVSQIILVVESLLPLQNRNAIQVLNCIRFCVSFADASSKTIWFLKLKLIPSLCCRCNFSNTIQFPELYSTSCLFLPLQTFNIIRFQDYTRYQVSFADANFVTWSGFFFLKQLVFLNY